MEQYNKLQKMLTQIEDAQMSKETKDTREKIMARLNVEEIMPLLEDLYKDVCSYDDECYNKLEDEYNLVTGKLANDLFRHTCRHRNEGVDDETWENHHSSSHKSESGCKVCTPEVYYSFPKSRFEKYHTLKKKLREERPKEYYDCRTPIAVLEFPPGSTYDKKEHELLIPGLKGCQLKKVVFDYLDSIHYKYAKDSHDSGPTIGVTTKNNNIEIRTFNSAGLNHKFEVKKDNEESATGCDEICRTYSKCDFDEKKFNFETKKERCGKGTMKWCEEHEMEEVKDFFKKYGGVYTLTAMIGGGGGRSYNPF